MYSDKCALGNSFPLLFMGLYTSLGQVTTCCHCSFFCIIDNMNLASLLFFVFLIIKHKIVITDLRKLVVDKLSERRGAILPNTNLDYHNNHLHVLLWLSTLAYIEKHSLKASNSVQKHKCLTIHVGAVTTYQLHLCVPTSTNQWPLEMSVLISCACR